MKKEQIGYNNSLSLTKEQMFGIIINNTNCSEVLYDSVHDT